MSPLERLSDTRGSRHFTEDQKKIILQDLIDFELLFQKAMREKFALTNDAVRRKIVTEYLDQYINKHYAPSREEMLKFYNDNKTDIDGICLRHILISVSKHGEKEAKQKADMVWKLLNEGNDFMSLAVRFSEDLANNADGGDLGCITAKKQFVPEFMKAAFELKKPGEYTAPVQTTYGYHVIILTEDRRGYAANESLIQRQLTLKKREKAFQEMLVELKSKAEIETDFNRLADVNLTVSEEPNP